MQTDENSNTEAFVDVNTDNLDEFNDLLQGKAKPIEEVEATEEKTTEEPAENLEAKEEQESKDEEAEPQKPKSRFQERISELTRAKKEAEARAAEALAQLEAYKSDKKTVDAPVKTSEAVQDDTPTAEDVNEDGSPKYPLGEFDPAFIRDLTRYTIKKEGEAEAIRQEEIRKAKQEQAQAQALQETWQEKLNETVKEKPDFIEKAQTLEETFRDLDPSYGDYLAQTIMSMEAGPEVLYYLANNIEEAQEIADLGAVKATIALGHLEAALTVQSKQKDTIKVSAAPEPPVLVNKGTRGSVPISADTDSLDDFEKLFFANKRKR